MSKQRRIIVIGLDGASLNYLNPIFKAGQFEGFSKFAESGFLGDCLSTIPPLTPPAWTSLMTGVNPGKHGIFDFIQPDASGIFRMVDASFCRRKSFFDYLADHGTKIISLLVPYTFPPKPDFPGVIVSGLGTPSSDSDFIRPHSLREIFLTEFTHLKEIDPTKGQTLATLSSYLIQHTKGTIELVKRSMHEVPDWGVCFVVFQATDLISHFYCRYFDPAHPDYSAGSNETKLYGEAMKELLAVLDPFMSYCRQLVEDSEGLLILVSDHGSQPLIGAIGKDAFLKDWLVDNGYLATAGNERRAVNRAKVQMNSAANRMLYLLKRKTPHGLRHLLNRIFGKYKESIVSSLQAIPFMESIIWERTRAFVAPGGYGTGIYINRKGYFPQGIIEPGADYHELREQIKQELKKLLISPEIPLLKEVLNKEEAFWGTELECAPDLVLIWNEHPSLREHNYMLCDGRKLQGPEKKVGTELRWCGTHRIEGILGLTGYGIRKKPVLRRVPVLADVMPTILYYAGLPVPDDLDGQVLLEAFEPGFIDNNPILHGPSEKPGDKSAPSMTQSESEKLIDLLEGLGYLH